MFALPELRVALGLGDQELEQRLRPVLDAADDLAIVVHCLAADQLLSAVESRQVDAGGVGWSLHRLTETVIAQLERAPVKVVLLVADPGSPAGPIARRPCCPSPRPPTTFERCSIGPAEPRRRVASESRCRPSRCR